MFEKIQHISPISLQSRKKERNFNARKRIQNKIHYAVNDEQAKKSEKKRKKAKKTVFSRISIHETDFVSHFCVNMLLSEALRYSYYLNYTNSSFNHHAKTDQS